jgi:isocitrate/isopropylmalate dehydrogenase
MSLKSVAVIEGEDASPEAVQPVVDLIAKMNLGIEWVYPPVGDAGIKQYNSLFPDQAKEMIDSSDSTLFGSAGNKSVLALLYLRWGKQTYANVRPVKYLAGYKSPMSRPEGIDMVIVRENTEDLYLMLEGDLKDLGPANLESPILHKTVSNMGDGKYGIKVITNEASMRISKFAFELARQRKAKGFPGKVTASSKYNMLSQSDGLFINTAKEVSKSYPDIAFETMIVDNLAHYMIMNPQKLDVVLLPNLYGDILSDASAALIGGLGLAPSGCYGDTYAYFESVHGTAPDIAGQNIINPTATLLAASMMLSHLGFEHASADIENAMAAVYREGRFLTPDQGGKSSTTEFIKAVADKIASLI